jgi:hypothetical protein
VQTTMEPAPAVLSPRRIQYAPLVLFGAALAVRLVFVHIAPNNTTDAWSRYQDALAWLKNPLHLPQETTTDAWLPLHIWLLGCVAWLGKSEMSARLFTVSVGSLTVLPYWGIVQRAFSRRAAFVSTLLLTLFGFHIAFSVTTGSEVPTIFFLAVGVYGWVRYRSEPTAGWLLLAALALGAACWCRFEAWLFSPVLSVMLLDFSHGWSGIWKNRRAWLHAGAFGVCASAGAASWMLLSFVKWGDPLALPHRTISLNLRFRAEVLRHGLLFRTLVAPGSVLASLSPLLLALALLGVLQVLLRGNPTARSLAFLLVVLFSFNEYNAVRYEITQARYTLMYSWLLIPFVLPGLESVSQRWPRAASGAALAGVVAFFVLWQGGIALYAQFGRSQAADKLDDMSPMIPLHREMRGLTKWLRLNASPSEATVLDDLNWESDTIMRFSGLDPSRTFRVTPELYANPSLLNGQVEDFIRRQNPRIVICSPYGLIGKAWHVGDLQGLQAPVAGIRLRLAWQGAFWRVYRIQ